LFSGVVVYRGWRFFGYWGDKAPECSINGGGSVILLLLSLGWLRQEPEDVATRSGKFWYSTVYRSLESKVGLAPKAAKQGVGVAGCGYRISPS